MPRRTFNKPNAAASQDRLPPHSVEAEQGLLGCVMLSPIECLNECEEAGLTYEWFYDVRHQLIFRAMAQTASKGALDVITLHETLKDTGDLEKAGGIPVLWALEDKTPGPAMLDFYLQIIRDKFNLRRALRIVGETTEQIYQKEHLPTQEILARMEQEVLKLGEDRQAIAEQKLKDLLLKTIEELEDYHRGGAQIKGLLKTGLDYNDKFLCGLGGANGNFVVISARPGFGKTSIATQIAMYAALDHRWFEPVIEHLPGGGMKPVLVKEADGRERFKVEPRRGVPVGIFSLEMAAEPLVHRMLFQRAEADMQRWRTGFSEGEDVPKLVKAAAKMAAPENVYIDDTSRCTIDSLKAKARRWHRQYGIKLFVIDYIQLMRTSGKRFRDDRVQELTEISGEIQALGKELYVPIIVLAQMNRDYEKDPKRRPRLSDLKDCGAIEQDADLVGFLYGPKLRKEEQQTYEAALLKAHGEDWSKAPRRVNLYWAKNRYGPTGDVQLLFQRSCTRFLDYVEWLKENGVKESAAGEPDYSDRKISDEDMPE